MYDQYDRVSEKHSPKLFDHERLKEIEQIEQIEHYSYNLNNTLKTITRVDKTSLNFEYDSNENITRVVATAPNGEKEALNYSYDALSNLEEATTNQHHLEILYSKKANPNIQVQNGIDVHRDYDIDDEDKLRTLSFLGESVHYNYDEFFKLESLSYNLKNINFTYDKNQALNQRAYPNETKELLKHDANYNLLSIGDETESTTYEYNKNNQLIERFNEQTDKEPINYAYNKRGELSQAGEQHYTYSKAGNQTQEEQQYNNLNHLTEDSTYTYSYDARGNLQNKTHKENRTKTLYSFNLFNQLIKVSKTDPQENPLEVVEYSYDALNRRVSKSITKKENDELTTLTHHYLYDEHNIVAILDHNKELLATIVHDQEIDTPLSITTHQNKARELTQAEAYLYEEFDEETKEFLEKKRQQRTYYYHRDHQGSISKLTDEEGNTVERFIYDAYGKIVEHTQTQDTLNPYCYTGREFDGVGMYDLYYYRARYYDPNIGRFISSDPIEFLAGDFNFFRYVGNSPVNFRDPFGFAKDDCDEKKRQKRQKSIEASEEYFKNEKKIHAKYKKRSKLKKLIKKPSLSDLLYTFFSSMVDLPSPEEIIELNEAAQKALANGGEPLKGDQLEKAKAIEKDCDEKAKETESKGGERIEKKDKSKDSKRMSKKKVEEAAKNNDYKDAHAMKKDLGLDSKSDIFIDKDGNMYSGGTKNYPRPLESLHMNANGY